MPVSIKKNVLKSQMKMDNKVSFLATENTLIFEHRVRENRDWWFYARA